jgi:hypothetical protein
MRFAEKASRSNMFPIFWATDHIFRLFPDLEGYLRKVALRITWPSFGNTSVYVARLKDGAFLAANLTDLSPEYYHREIEDVAKRDKLRRG